MMAVQELIGTPVSKQLLAPWRPVACASIMALVIRSSDKWLMKSLHAFGHSAWTASVVMAGAVTYIGSMFLLWAISGCPEGIESKVAALTTETWNKLARHRSTFES